MVQSLEQYVAQATQAYQPAQTAVQNQINALSGQLETANEAINKNYAQQQAGLNRQRNMAAETASMQAAGSGGSFGGAANIANRKYYDQTFVPAVTQLRTGQANELAQARQANENQRTALNSQLSQLQAQANQEALRQYWNAQEAEAQRQAQLRAQREANAAQNAYYKYLMDAAKSGSGGNSSIGFIDYLNSDAYNKALPSDMSASEKQYWTQKMIENYTNAKNNNDQRALNNIYNGSVWQSYLNHVGRS